VRAVSFTGSVATGHGVRDAATASGKRVQLELGGQNPVIVMDDADLPAAAAATVAGAFWSAGQKCTATRRIYVQAGAYERFRGELLERVAALRVGDPADAATEVGPLVSEKQLRSVLDGIEQGRTEGGSPIAGGARAEVPGLLVEPTLFEDVADDGFLSREEVFGPVAALYPFADLDEAIARANAVPHGLSAAIFTRDIGAARQFVARLEAGLLHVNSQTAGADVHVPFGGIKASGHGPHEQGRAAREFYTDVVTVYEDS
jgi:aldehyde dehydrogenase (NAD+)